MKHGIPVLAVIPMPEYAQFFNGQSLTAYQSRLALCEKLVLDAPGTDQEKFEAAGRYIVDNSDLLFAVWDGAPSHGRGGTADIVDYARSHCKPVVYIDPILRTVSK
jgi:hypothetical protein